MDDFQIRMLDMAERLFPKVERCIDLLLLELEARQPSKKVNLVEVPVGGASGVRDNVVPFKPRDEFKDLTAGAEPSEVPTQPAHLVVLQDRLVKIIDDNYDLLHDSITALGCRGDCYRCPHPEKPTVEDQVKACLGEALEGLDLDRSLINP